MNIRNHRLKIILKGRLKNIRMGLKVCMSNREKKSLYYALYSTSDAWLKLGTLS